MDCFPFGAPSECTTDTRESYVQKEVVNIMTLLTNAKNYLGMLSVDIIYRCLRPSFPSYLPHLLVPALNSARASKNE